MSGDFGVAGGADLRRISQQLRQAANGKELRRELGKELRRASKPMVAAAKSSALAIPTHGEDHSGLRARIARSIGVSVDTSGADARVKLRADGRKMPDEQKALPAYMEGRKKRWRHPVYGNKEVWVDQAPHPYFYQAIKPFIPGTREAVIQALENTIDKLK